MKVLNFKDLLSWQKAMDIVANVYGLVKLFPAEERYALTDQLRRAAISIPSNIAEGQGRNSEKEFVHFLGIAIGSAAEVETQLLAAVRIGYLEECQIQETVSLIYDVIRLIKGLQQKLLAKINE